MATGSRPDSIFYGVYDKYVGDARTKPEVYGYWILVVGLLAVLSGSGLFVIGQVAAVGLSAVAVRQWAIVLGASGGVGLLLGSVLQLPLRRRAIRMAVAGAVCSLTMIGVFAGIYPEDWGLETTTSLLVGVGYVGGLTVVALMAALIPVVTGRRSLLLDEEEIEPLAWTIEEEEEQEENISAVMSGEEPCDGVFAVLPRNGGRGRRFVE
jgi:hypothetical protein